MPTKYKGYMGDMLMVDLSSGEVSHYDVPDEDYENYLGGKGLAAKILFDLLPSGTDPLGEDAILIINTGPLTGSWGPCTSRFNVSCKSPLTGVIASSNCGGDFGIKLKSCGFDGIIIRGKAKKPVYLDITEGGVEIKDAAHLWGKNTEETQEALDPKAGKAVIGVAGENLVRYAAIISQERAAGRCGVGAVMGSKNLKALQAKGSLKVPVHDQEGFKKAIQEWIAILKKNPITGDTLPKYGTVNFLSKLNIVGGLPTGNFQKGRFDDAEKISGETLADTLLKKNMGCVSCPIRCGRVVEVDGKLVKGPEFETIGLFGSNMLNADLGMICKWNRTMDLLGMDTISAGGTIAFAMELKQRGLLETDLEFGRTDNIDRVLHDIATRRGLGDDLANGTRAMAEKYGGKEFAIHIKGLEVASYDPRIASGMGLGYATANRGGCHLNSGYLIFFERLGPVNMDPYATGVKPSFVWFQQNVLEAISCAGTCVFTSYASIPPAAHKMNPHGFAATAISKVLTGSGPVMNRMPSMVPKMMPIHLMDMIPHSVVISKLTGMNCHLGNFVAAGERSYTVERLFNLSEGMRADQDTLPKRFTDEVCDPAEPRSKVPLEKMLPQYYKVRGWDRDGVPTPALLRRLGMKKYSPK